MNWIMWNGKQFITASSVNGSVSYGEKRWNPGEMFWDGRERDVWYEIKSVELAGGSLNITTVPENPDSTLIEAVQAYFGDEIQRCRDGGTFTDKFKTLVHALDKELEAKRSEA